MNIYIKEIPNIINQLISFKITKQGDEDSIEDFGSWASSQYAGTILGDETQFRLAISQGAGVSFSVNYGDGTAVEQISSDSMKSFF